MIVAMSGMDSLGEKATKMRALQESQTITDNVVTILGSFDSRLSILETVMRPTQWRKAGRFGIFFHRRLYNPDEINGNYRSEKIQTAGIESSLKLKFDRMYSGVIATRQYAWAPSSGAVGANEVDLGTSNVGLEGANLEEGSEDSEEDVNPNLENHISRGVGGVHV